MKRLTLQNFLIFLILAFLIVSAFLIRLKNFKSNPVRSIDEIVYYRLGLQLTKDLSDYNIIEYGRELAATGRSLPQYFFAALFKHPPLFPLMIAGAMKIFGNQIISGEYISLLFGVFMIPLVYFLGSVIVNKRVGLASAFFIYIDPVNIICSQKVWMETTVAFFTVLAIFLFIYGVNQNKDSLFIYSGIASGFAGLTKYPGILATFVVALYCIIYKPEVFRNRKFLTGLVSPFLMLLPWVYWNYLVYGPKFLANQTSIHNFGLMGTRTQLVLLMWIFLAIGVIAGLRKPIRIVLFEKRPKGEDVSSLKLSTIVYWGVFCTALYKNIVHSLQFEYLPTASWMQGLFYNETPFFYFGRLIEWSLLYLFAFASLFFDQRNHPKGKSVLTLGAFVLFIFYMIWQSYQSRYILAAIPFLVILAADFINKFFVRTQRMESFGPRLFSRGSLVIILCYIIMKTLYINNVLSYPNDMCYF